ncbi:hypothetical protein [Streptomyces sp. MN13]
MSTPGRRYGYVGPPHLLRTVRPGTAGHAVHAAADLDAWAAERGGAELAEPFTFVVTPDGLLRLAPRRSEHVACAGGGDVLGGVSSIRPGSRRLVPRLAALSSVPDSPKLSAPLEQGGPPSHRLPPPPCDARHQTPLPDPA